MNHMKNLPISEARCSGTDHKLPATICPQRNSCHRHLQLELDRQLELPSTVLVKVLSLPRVGKHDCHFWRAV